ncbi:ABC transporter substrate-binding protein (plasmid) [Arthrobacter sp. KN11-1C]|uniref:ABC transporter substrate-binding protein n=1 Tax=Arthrobacter sp. KN11-1C TaxID=3445774 RepID=UPI003F9EF96B
MNRRLAALGSIAVISLGLAACSNGATAGAQDPNANKTLSIYAWADEIPKSVTDAFEKETGIKVTVDSFDSNETMTSKLSAGGASYDLVEPSQYAVTQLATQGLIAELDHSKLQGLDNLSPQFANPSYDPKNAHSIPWVWGTTGLAYNEDCTGGPVDSWQALFDAKYKGKIYMLDNMLSSYVAALQVNGFKASSTNETEIAKATDSLLKQKPLLAGYNSTNQIDLLSKGQACVVQTYGGTSLAKAAAANPKIHYVIPKEGGSVWTDTLAIVKGSPNSEAAYKFLNFTLRPEIAALATDDASLASANAKAKALVKDQSTTTNPAIYAPDAAVAKADFLLDPGTALRFFQQGWTKVRAS